MTTRNGSTVNLNWHSNGLDGDSGKIVKKKVSNWRPNVAMSQSAI